LNKPISALINNMDIEINKKHKEVLVESGAMDSCPLAVKKMHNTANKLINAVMNASKCASVGVGNTSIFKRNRLKPIIMKQAAAVVDMLFITGIVLSGAMIEYNRLSRPSSMWVMDSRIFKMPIKQTHPASALARMCFVLE
jgi:hypothetical protein